MRIADCVCQPLASKLQTSWKTYLALGELSERKGDLPAARSAYASAVQVIDQTAERLQDQRIRETFLAAQPVKELRAKLDVLSRR